MTDVYPKPDQCKPNVYPSCDPNCNNFCDPTCYGPNAAYSTACYKMITNSPDPCDGVKIGDDGTQLLETDSPIEDGYRWFMRDVENSLDPGCGVTGTQSRCQNSTAKTGFGNSCNWHSNRCNDAGNINQNNYVSCKADANDSCRNHCVGGGKFVSGNSCNGSSQNGCNGDKVGVRAAYQNARKLSCCLGTDRDTENCGRCWCNKDEFIHSADSKSYEYEIKTGTSMAYVPRTCVAHIVRHAAGISPDETNTPLLDTRFDVQYPPPVILGAQLNATEDYKKRVVSEGNVESTAEFDQMSKVSNYLSDLLLKSESYQQDYGDYINPVIKKYCTTLMPDKDVGAVTKNVTSTCEKDKFVTGNPVQTFCSPFTKQNGNGTQYGAIREACSAWFDTQTDALTQNETKQTDIIKTIGENSMKKGPDGAPMGGTEIKVKSRDPNTGKLAVKSVIVPVNEARCTMKTLDPYYNLVKPSTAGMQGADYCWYIPCVINAGAMLTTKQKAEQDDPNAKNKCPKKFCGQINNFINDNEVEIENSSFNDVAACGGSGNYTPSGYECGAGGKCEKTGCDPSSVEGCYPTSDCQGMCKKSFMNRTWMIWVIVGVLAVVAIILGLVFGLKKTRRRRSSSAK